MMRATSVKLPPRLKMRAVLRAKQMGISLGEFIRQALKTALVSKKQTEDPLFNDFSVYEGRAPKDGARNHDRYIYGTNRI